MLLRAFRNMRQPTVLLQICGTRYSCIRCVCFYNLEMSGYFLRAQTSAHAGVSGVARANEAFSPAFDAAYTAHVQRKLGLSGMELGNGWIDKLRTTGSETFGERSSDAQFVSELFRLMASCRADFTRTWRALIDVPALSLVLHASELSSVRIRARAGKPGGLETSPSGPVGDLASGLLERNLRGAGIAEDGDSLDAIDAVTDREALRPVIGILNAAAASNEQMHEWADWVREYMARIDSQVIRFRAYSA